MPDIRVLIIADDRLVRAGLAALLAGQTGFAVAGQTAAGDALTGAAAVYQPDVWLWDLGWEPTAAIEQLAELGEPQRRVVALLPDGEGSHAADAWAAGAQGLLLRDVETARLLAALAAVAEGLVVVEPALAAALRPAAGRPAPAAPLEGLTARELEVLRLMAEGLANKAIAHRLGISEHTVKFHINAILGKLGVQSRTEAVVHATRLGLIIL